MTPEEKARQEIDAMLTASGWVVQSKDKINLSAAHGVVIHELSFTRGEPDCTLFAEGKAIGTVEAKPEGFPLIGVEEQSTKYVTGFPGGLPAWRKPLPFCYESTGSETRFTNRLDPDPRSRNVFTFHRPETLLAWVQRDKQLAQRLREYPPLKNDGLWPAQFAAISNLEKSIAGGRRRALIQMATGSGKTFTAVNFVYRILKQADINTRILFLVDRGNLGDQTLKEFQQFVSPLNNFKFTEEFIVQHLTSNTLDKSARVVIGTIQRLYSMLRGEPDLDPELDEKSGYEFRQSLWKQPLPVTYNPALPIETFDFIITDECHRSIYNLWRQVLEYFDASLIGLTATPNKQTFGFFEQNLVMEYNHEKAVADGVNVNYDVYRIPRIAVTVDMIATGTDVKPLEVVFFMRSVKSLSFFEQMKGRGVRVITDTDFQAVTPDAKSKTRFVIVDAVGVCERDKSDSCPLDRKPHVPFEKLLEAVALGNREPDTLTSLAGRLARLERALDDDGKKEIQQLTGGQSASQLARGLLDALDPDLLAAKAKEGKPAYHKPTEQDLCDLRDLCVNQAAAPLATNPDLRKKLTDLQRAADQTIDTISKDKVLFAGTATQSTDDARKLTRSFRQYLDQNRVEIEARQILYSRPYRKRLTESMLKEPELKLKEKYGPQPVPNLWHAYEISASASASASTSGSSYPLPSGGRAIKGEGSGGEGERKSVVKKNPAARFADLVALVRFALEPQPVLEPFADSVTTRFNEWLMDKAKAGVKFNPDQLAWLNLIRDHIATSLSIEPDDFEFTPFVEKGGLGKATLLFSPNLAPLLSELSEVLVS